MKLETARMTGIPANFHCYVHYIETGQQTVKLANFATLEELHKCVAYYYERAVARPELASTFALKATKIYYLYCENDPRSAQERMTFRKALISESQNHLEQVRKRLETASNITKKEAIGEFTFFGELYNNGFIFNGILKRYIDIFKLKMNECDISRECFYLLINLCKEKVLSLANQDEFDYTVATKGLIMLMKEAEEMEKEPQPRRRQSLPEPPKTFDQQFPMLEKSPENEIPVTLPPPTFEEQLAAFKQMLEETQRSSAEIIKKISTEHNHFFDEGKWQLYYEVLIERAIESPEMAATIVDVCQKLPKCKTDAWHRIKSDDYKKLIFAVITKSLSKWIIEEGSPTQEIGILKFIQKLMDHSLCSIGNMANLIEVLVNLSSKNKPYAARVLLQIILQIKTKISVEKIRKLPENIRQKTVQIIVEAYIDKTQFQSDVSEIKNYLLDSSSNFQQVKPKSTSQSPIGGASSSARHISPSSSAGSFDNYLYEVPIVDYSYFIDNFNVDDAEAAKQSVREMCANGWNLIELAEHIFEKIVSNGQYTIYLQLASFINQEAQTASSTSFEETLWNVAIKNLPIELSKKESSDARAVATAHFIGELYSLGKIDNTCFFRCCEQAAGEFESTRRMKIFLGLVKFSSWKVKNNYKVADERFIYYLQNIRLRKTTAKDASTIQICQELIQLLENITAMNGNIMINGVNDTVPVPAAPPGFNAKTLGHDIVAKPDRVEIQRMKTFVRNLIYDMDSESQNVQKIDIKDEKDLELFVNEFLEHVMDNHDVNQMPKYAKMTQKLDGLAINKTSFKFLLIKRCLDKLVENLKARQVSKLDSGTNSLVGFIAELYILDVLSKNYVISFLNLFMDYEPHNQNAQLCMNQMMMIVGAKLEREDVSSINVYFKHFETIVNTQNRNDVRTTIYANLITLRKNKWLVTAVVGVGTSLFASSSTNIFKTRLGQSASVSPIARPGPSPPIASSPRISPKPDPFASLRVSKTRFESIEPTIAASSKNNSKTVIINFQNTYELDSTVANLKQELTSVGRVKSVISAILSRLSTNYQEISSCATIFTKLVNSTITSKSGEEIFFKDCLNEALENGYSKTQVKFTDCESSFTSLIIIAGELYKRNIVSDVVIDNWILHRNTKNLAIPHLTYLSSIIAPKIQTQGSDRLKMVLKLFEETTIHQSTIDMLSQIRSEISELEKEVEYLANYKAKNPDFETIINNF